MIDKRKLKRALDALNTNVVSNDHVQLWNHYELIETVQNVGELDLKSARALLLLSIKDNITSQDLVDIGLLKSIHRSSASPLIKTLVFNELVTMNVVAGQGRRYHWQITETGRSIIKRAIESRTAGKTSSSTLLTHRQKEVICSTFEELIHTHELSEKKIDDLQEEVRDLKSIMKSLKVKYEVLKSNGDPLPVAKSASTGPELWRNNEAIKRIRRETVFAKLSIKILLYLYEFKTISEEDLKSEQFHSDFGTTLNRIQKLITKNYVEKVTTDQGANYLLTPSARDELQGYLK